MKDVLREWFIQAPWGKIALISWGNPEGQPVLLIHGLQDSAATFMPILELMPMDYHYVALDLPGHGRSDPFPVGVFLMRPHYIQAIDVTIDHLEWEDFTCMGHSMGTEIGLFYNIVKPNRVKKFIHLDPSLSFRKTLSIQKCTDYYSNVQEYYMNYDSYVQDSRVFSKQKAVDSVKRARRMTDVQAELILSRNLKEIGPDLYKLSWDRRLKILLPWQLTEDFYSKLITQNAPPTLVLIANDSLKIAGYENWEVRLNNFIQRIGAQIEHFRISNVDGGHDVHFTNPERIAKEVCEFLERDFVTKSKL